MKTQHFLKLGTSVALALLLLGTASAQSRFSKHEISINGFRNPSTGLEYRYHQISVHAGYYPTILTNDANGSGQTSSFLRVGASFWFLPVGKRENPSSFYTSVSYLQALDAKEPDQNGVIGDVGFRWMVWKGLALRLGAAASYSGNKGWRLNPTPGISYSLFFK